ncbi:MAG: hypothetical protein FJX77_14975, partial [Armatimonadetes bacterium]|nr:hypothetical protein [Armatimonadota bacterium]
MPYCINHPATDTTQFCSQCGYPFCGSCLVDFLGQAHCGACRDRRLVSMQTPVSTTAPFQGTNQVDISRWIEGGWRIVSQDLGSWIGATLLCFLLGTLCFPILPMLMGGMVLMACQKLTRGYVTFDTFWSGFRRSGPLLASTACYVLFWGLLVGVYLGIMWLPVAFLGNSEASSVVAVLGLVGYYILMPALGIAGA